MQLLRSLVLAWTVVVLAGGCASPDESGDQATVTDALGRTVSFERPVRRVVSLAPNLTEIAFAAGGGGKLVAVTTADDYPPATDTIDRVSALPVDFETITAKQPDLILATDQVNPPGDTETFSSLDLPVYFFSFSSLEDVFRSIRRTGTLLGTESTARDTVRALRRRAKRLRARTSPLPAAERPRVLVLIGDQTLYGFGQDSYIHTLVEMAGGRSITDSLDAQAPTLTDEYVLTQKPDVIVGAWGPNYDPARLLELHPTWDVVPAVQNDRIYSLPADLLLRPGPRLVEGAWRMAAQLHPSRITDSKGDGTPTRPRPDSLSSPPAAPDTP